MTQVIYYLCFEQGGIKINFPCSPQDKILVCVHAHACSSPKASVGYIKRGCIVGCIVVLTSILGSQHWTFICYTTTRWRILRVYRNFIRGRQTYVMRATHPWHGQGCKAWQHMPVRLHVPMQPAQITKYFGTQTLYQEMCWFISRL